MFIGVVAINTLELTFFGCLLVLCGIVFVQWSLAKLVAGLIPARCVNCNGLCTITIRPRRIYECKQCGHKWYTLERYGDDGSGGLGG